MSSEYTNSSLYASTPQVTFLLNYLDFWNPPTVPVSINDDKIVLATKYQRRPDILSYDLYGTHNYWWVFMMRNPDVIKDPIWDFKAGIEIFIPKKENLPRSTQSL